MTILIIGLILFIGMHLSPSAVGFRAGLIAKMGENGYKVMFSLVSIAGFGLIIYGYSIASSATAWQPPLESHVPTMLLVIVGLILFVASVIPSNIQRIVVHPQLIGVSLWAIGHLLVNGNQRDVLLFGGFLLFGILSLVFHILRNKRNHLDKLPVGRDIAVVVVGIAVYLALLFGHEFLFGVGVAPG